MAEAAAPAIAAAAGVLTLLQNARTPRKTYKSGRKFLQDTGGLLTGPGKVIPDPTYQQLVDRYLSLQEQREILEQETRKFPQSLLKRKQARKFKTLSEELFCRVKSLSDDIVIQSERDSRRQRRRLSDLRYQLQNLGVLTEEDAVDHDSHTAVDVIDDATMPYDSPDAVMSTLGPSLSSNSRNVIYNERSLNLRADELESENDRASIITTDTYYTAAVDFHAH